MKVAAAAALALLAAAAEARAAVVVCAPGYPGTTAEAQGAMDAFAAALAKASGLPAGSLAAEYHEREAAGVARLRTRDAAVAIVALPFFLKHEKALGLRARLEAAPKDRGALERWALVARRGRVSGPAALDGFTVASSAGYAPAFGRGAVAAWGRLPAGARVVASSAVLSSLRRAAAGEPVAVLLDGAQEAALASLPFAQDLEVLARSPPFPVAVVADVDARLPARRFEAVASGLARLPSDPAGAAALEGIRMARFEPLDAAALDAARRGFAAGAR